jgi:diadenylate cyclase
MSITLFRIGFLPVTVMDILDILIMSYVIFRVYDFLRGSRGAQMLVGLVIIMVFSVIAPLVHMRGISWILQNLRTVWLVAFVILFQPELRRMLIQVGQSRVVRYFVKVSGNKMIEEVVEAASALREKGYGALIVMARETGLKSVSESGIRLQAEVSSELILSIFNPRSPLHDGAIVIQNDIIESARCILPLVEMEKTRKKLGTRHRAALGLSEETDAMVIVISEETGKVSIAIDGELFYDLSESTLKEKLEQGLATFVSQEAHPRRQRQETSVEAG